MDKRVNLAASLSLMIYDDITQAGVEMLGLKIVKILKHSSTYGAVLLSQSDKTFYIVFRGTENFKDILTDIDCDQKKTYIDHKECKLHDGFLRAYGSITSQINSIPFGTYRLVICGHSLGGALATICSADLLCLNARTVITFGSPMVGDKAFVAIFNSEVRESIRFVYENDVVPMLPRVNYKHVGGEVRLDKNGNQIGRYNFIRNFIRWIKGKGGFLSIKDHHMSNYITSVSLWNKHV